MFEIRLAAPSDLPALRALVPASVRALGAGWYTPEPGFSQLELVATLPGEPLYRALGFAPRERYEVPLPGGLGLPVVRMVRAASSPGPGGSR